MLRRNLITAMLLAVMITGGALSVAAQQGYGPLEQGTGAVAAALEAAVAETGLASSEIVAQIADGATLADVVEASGGDVQVVIDAAVAAMTDRVNSAVNDGLLTETRASLMLGHLEAVVTDAVNGDWSAGPFFGRGAGMGRGAGRGRFGAGTGPRLGRGLPYYGGLLDELELDRQSFADEWRAGGSLADAIVEAGGDPVAARDAALERIETRHALAVEAGWMTQAQADLLLAAAESRWNVLLGLEATDL